MYMITVKAEELKSLKAKTIGLIGKNCAQPVFFKTRFGIHTFGLNFPIDVLILDDTNCVQVIKKGLKTKRIFIWNPKHVNVLELPEGQINKLKITLNSKIDLNLK